jgi:hypothetical protein
VIPTPIPALAPGERPFEAGVEVSFIAEVGVDDDCAGACADAKAASQSVSH